MKLFGMRAGFGICLLLTLLGCSERVRISDQELIGTYVAGFDHVTSRVVDYKVKEQITLNPDHTYIQVLSWYPRQFTNRGTWKSSNSFLSGTEVELTGFLRGNLENDNMSNSQSYGPLNLEVRRKKGKLTLAFYEHVDWGYYDRAQ